MATNHRNNFRIWKTRKSLMYLMFHPELSVFDYFDTLIKSMLLSFIGPPHRRVNRFAKPVPKSKRDNASSPRYNELLMY